LTVTFNFMPVYSAIQLRSLTKNIFVAESATEENAETVANHLVRANLAGHDSHGILRIPGYASSIENGELDPRATGTLEIDDHAVGVFNGNRGFGQVIATNAMRIAIDKARHYGVSAIGVYKCGHIGRMADYCMMAMQQDMIGITTANMHPIMSAFGGAERVFNASPIGAAVPTSRERPFVLDISMGMSVEGKIFLKKARGEKLSQGEIVDKDGKPSIEPDDYLSGGSIQPFGGSLGYKSYGLAFLIDILSGALGGSGCASSADRLEGNGVFMIAIDICKFTALERFKKTIDEVIRKVKQGKKAVGFNEILIPGEPEFLEEEKRLTSGIFIEDSTIGQISEIASRLHVEMPEPFISAPKPR